MLNEGGLRIKGEVEVVLRDMAQGGKVKYSFKKSNLIVTAGAAALAALVANNSGTRPSHMGIGSSTTAPAAAQTDLQSPLNRQARGSTSRSSNQITYSASFATGVGTGTVQEGGLFNAGAAGTMYARFLTGAFVKGATDALTMTWKLTFGTM